MFRMLIVTAVLVALVILVQSGGREAPSGPAIVTTLSELASEPDRYEGRLVTVGGKVGTRVSVLGYGGVNLVDRRGHEVLVMGLSTPPAPGARLEVTGTYWTALAAGDFAAPIIFVE